MVNFSENVPVEKSFEISIFTRISEVKVQSVSLFLFVENEVKLKEAFLRFGSKEVPLRFYLTNFNDYDGKAYKIDLKLEDYTSLFESFSQLLFGLSAGDLRETEIAFGFDVAFQDGSREYFSSFDDTKAGYPLPKIKLNFYQPQSLAGKALVLKNNASFSFRFNNEVPIDDLLVEFWAKINSFGHNFFYIIDEISRDTVLSLSSNNFKIISPNINPALEIFERQFLSKNVWNHFSIFFNTKKDCLEVFSNDKLMYRIPFEGLNTLQNYRFGFLNPTFGKGMQLDLIKVWEYRNSLDYSFLNKHYLNYDTDSSRVLLNLSFDDYKTNNRLLNSESISFKFENIDYVYSDAPIFSRAPELNVYAYGSFYSIEWKKKESTDAVKFILEKSTGGENFIEINSQYANDDPDKTYYYSDLRNRVNEIVIYRLKQINTDASFVYSAQVKIGQGEQKLFTVLQNFPNPFNPETNIAVEVLETSEIEISVFDVVGKKIITLQEGILSQGMHSFTFDGSNLPSGIYFYEVKSPNYAVIRKMILAK